MSLLTFALKAASYSFRAFAFAGCSATNTLMMASVSNVRMSRVSCAPETSGGGSSQVSSETGASFALPQYVVADSCK